MTEPINPYTPPTSQTLTPMEGGCPLAVIAAMEKINKAAKGLTSGLIVSIFVPIGMVFVAIIAIAYLVKTRKLCKAHPEVCDFRSAYGSPQKRQLKQMANDDPTLKTLVEFSEARIGLWVMIIFPFFFIAMIVVLARIFLG